MRAIAGLFNETVLVLPGRNSPEKSGEIPLSGHELRVVPLSLLYGHDMERKLRFPFWLLRNMPSLIREAVRCDAIHAPIPGDIGTVGMLLALILQKPLFVRHCGNWLAPRTVAERFWIWSMERFAGGRNIMLATGGQPQSPSASNPNIRWIFSTSLTEDELRRIGSVRSLPECLSVKLIIVCRQEPDKGTDLVLRSLIPLKKMGRDFHLDVVGDGTALLALKKMALELSLAQQVTFHGKVTHEEVLELLQQAHLFCYPTRASEGFPKVILEALASGLPVVTTRVSVLPELIGSGCGVLIENPNPGAVADAVDGIVSDPENYQRMSLQAVDTARSYSLEQWQACIGEALVQSWGPLRTNANAR